jgi:leader peptidase (prepilin peptidase) / N-methyltransferase
MTEPMRASQDEIAPVPNEGIPLRRLLPRGIEGAGVAVIGVMLAAASVARYGFDGRGLVGVVLCPTLVLLSAIDVRHRLLPNIIVLPAAAAVALIVGAADEGNLAAHAIAGGVFAGVLLVAALVYPAGLGMGDVKLALLIGLALGDKTGTAVFVTALASAAVSLTLLMRRGRSALRQSIPFGPLLALGGLVAYFFA